MAACPRPSSWKPRQKPVSSEPTSPAASVALSSRTFTVHSRWHCPPAVVTTIISTRYVPRPSSQPPPSVISTFRTSAPAGGSGTLSRWYRYAGWPFGDSGVTRITVMISRGGSPSRIAEAGTASP